MVVAAGAHPARGEDVIVNGVRVVSFDVSGNAVRGMQGNVEAYRNFVCNGEFDAVLIKAAQQWSFDALTSVLARVRSRKFLIPCGFSGLYAKAYRAYYSRMPEWLGQFDKLVFYASDYRDIQFAKAHGLSNFVILPNGADEREFADTDDEGFRKRHGVADDELLFLTVGSLNGAKGHRETARAFELARLDSPATLLLNGNAPPLSLTGRLRKLVRAAASGHVPSVNALVSRINSRGDGKRVLLVDLPRRDVVNAFKASDLFIFASHVEYSPLVLFEAAAAGTPFLSTPVGNAREIVQWTSAGLICESRVDSVGQVRPSPVALARCIESLTSDRGALAAMGQRGRHAFLDGGFSWDAISQRYEALLADNSEPCGALRRDTHRG